MLGDLLVYDVHGHVSTPPEFRAFAYNLQVLRTPSDSRLDLSIDAMRPAMERHLKMLDERRIDVQLISPRPVAMMHWERPYLVDAWTEATNTVIATQCDASAGRLVGIGQLPQQVEEDTSRCVAELERCIGELGFVGALLNPDPGGDRRAPGVHEQHFYPLYEAAEALDATLFVHPSISFDRRLEALSHGYQLNNVTEELLATLLFEETDVFDRFPRLRVVVAHCGGALSRFVTRDALDTREGGGQVGMPMARQAHEARDTSRNLFFDTCAYDGAFLGAAIAQRGVAQLVFGTESPGSGTRWINPVTGRPSDDVLSLLEALEVPADDIAAIVHHNPLRVFPLLARSSAGRG